MMAMAPQNREEVTKRTQQGPTTDDSDGTSKQRRSNKTKTTDDSVSVKKETKKTN